MVKPDRLMKPSAFSACRDQNSCFGFSLSLFIHQPFLFVPSVYVLFVDPLNTDQFDQCSQELNLLVGGRLIDQLHHMLLFSVYLWTFSICFVVYLCLCLPCFTRFLLLLVSFQWFRFTSCILYHNISLFTASFVRWETHHLVAVPVQTAPLQDEPVSLPFTSQEAAALLPAEQPALTVQHPQLFDRNTPPTHG